MRECAARRCSISARSARASEPKELHLVPGAGHVDLYDRVNLIPWDKLTSFFTLHLRGP